MTTPQIPERTLARIQRANLCVGCQHLFVPADDGGLDFGPKLDGTSWALGYCARCWAQLRSKPVITRPWPEGAVEARPDSDGHF